MPFFKRKSSISKAGKANQAIDPSQLNLQNKLIASKDNIQNELNQGRRTRQKLVPLCVPPDSENAVNGAACKALSDIKWDIPLKTGSRLSKTLEEVICDKDSLPYLIQYMELRGARHIIKFWLDAESFRESTLSLIQSHLMSNVIKSSDEKYSSENEQKHASSCNQISRLVSTGYNCQTQTQCASNSHSQHIDSGNISDMSDNGSCNSDKVDLHTNRVLSPSTSNGHTSEDTDSVESHQKPVCASQEMLQDKLTKNIEKDAVNIYSKYISLDATHPIGVTDELRNETIKKICREDGQIDPGCFQSCLQFISNLMEKEYYPDFVRSVVHSKHQVDVLTSGDVHLPDILHNETAMFYFMEFMEQENAMYLLEFYMTLDNFQSHLTSLQGKQCNAQQIQEDAMVLYEKYFSLQATSPLGFDDKVRFEVECNICRQGGPLPDCFSTPMKIAFYTLQKEFFPVFLQSELYYKYLNELINTIQTAQYVPNQSKHRRTGSDASSEHSVGSQSTNSEQPISAKNTLLATDSSKKIAAKKSMDRFANDLRITDMSMNPEAPLWLRPQTAGAMSLGHVTGMGQFVSELSPEPDNSIKKKGRFSKKKIAKEKAQEDMAWQIAQMIIKDVSKLTGNDESIPPSEDKVT